MAFCDALSEVATEPQTMAPSSGAKTYTGCVLHWYKNGTIKTSLCFAGEIRTLVS